MQTWRLLVMPAASGAWNMAVDEVLLEQAQMGKGAVLPTLRLYAWDPACLSLGHSQPFSDVDRARLERRGWDVVRRATGGRAILHTDELTYSVTGKAAEPVLAGGVLESYNRIARALLVAVRDIGLPVEMKEGKTSAQPTPNPVCFEVPSTYEITVRGRKLIGSAQARKKEGVLQHGSLPLTGDLARICQALAFENDQARTDAARRVLERAATVESVRGHPVDWQTAARAVVRAFESELGICFQTGELSESERGRAEELVKDKYASPSWTERV